MNLSVKGKLRHAVHAAFAVGMASAIAVPGVVQAQEEEATELGKISITGSRLKRADVEGAAPITIIDREQIELSGEISVSDLLRNMSFNSFGSFRQQSGSSAQGLAALDLRGLGSERTLILIDGKRAPKSPYAASAQDLNSIPLAAVERIEVLKDGASAIYGSDAIGGVVNIIFRKDFEGVQVMYGEGHPSVDGGDRREGSVVVGLNSGKGNVVFGASFNSTEIIYSRDQREFTPPGASFYSNNYLSSADGYGVYHPVVGGCEADDSFFEVPYSANPEGYRCAYDFTGVAANEASTKNRSLFAKGSYEISDSWSFYSTASIANATSFGRYAPVAAGFFIPSDVSGVDSDGDGNDDDIYVLHRFAALGPRDNEVDGNVYDILGGFEGTVGMFDIDLGARYNQFKTFDIGRNYSVTPVVESYVAQGLYDYVNPLNNSEDVLNAMKATISRVSSWETQEAWGSVSMDMFSMAGGMAGIAVGMEYRSIDFTDQYDSLSEAGVIGGSAGNSSGAERSLRGYFAEVVLPVLDNLEVTGALRYDDYSDYGSDVSPKVSLRYQPLDMLTVRASYGEGFRAPTLDIISQKPSFSAESIYNDEATCLNAGGTYDESAGCSVGVQINTTVTGNPDLESEQSTQYSFGVVVDPLDWVNFTLDYYHIKIEDTVSYFSVEDLVSLEEQGLGIPSGLELNRNSVTGAVSSAVSGYGNQGTVTTSGLDLDATVSHALGVYGKLSSQLNLSYILDYKIDNGLDPEYDIAGERGSPNLRSNLMTQYMISDFTFAWTANYIGKQNDGGGASSGSYTTHDFQASYLAPWEGRLTVGVQNAFEPDIPVYAYDGRPYNFYLYDAYGRIPYFRYTQSF